MPITKEVELEDGSKRIYHQTYLYNGKRRRRIFLEDKQGKVHQVAYGDNQKQFPVVLRSIPTL